MEALLELKAVLCDSEGNVCIDGSKGDLEIAQQAIEGIEQEITVLRTKVAELEAKQHGVVVGAMCAVEGRCLSGELRAQLTEAQAKVAELDESESQLIRERDHAEEMGTKLANAVGEFFRVDVGEYSNMNDPRDMALAILEGEYITDSDTDRKLTEAQAKIEAAGKQEPVAWYEKIVGMEVSMDVSTGESDAGNRIFGRVFEVMLESYGARDDIILAIEESRNFTAPPITTSGWLPIETAPKDGTRVLLWSSAWEAPSTGQYYGQPPAWRLIYQRGEFKNQPTHWMPLPTAPRGTEKEANHG